eukprot:2223367-Alexandrium_andersonii.AAC.1
MGPSNTAFIPPCGTEVQEWCSASRSPQPILACSTQLHGAGPSGNAADGCPWQARGANRSQMRLHGSRQPVSGAAEAETAMGPVLAAGHARVAVQRV